MKLSLVGLNHKTAPVAVREQVAFPESEIKAALGRLRNDFALSEGMILSTCNRVEVLGRSRENPAATSARIKEFLHAYHGLEPAVLDPHLYAFANEEVVNHVFGVACSLDSMVIGEPQILSQIKRAYQLAHQSGSTGRELNALLPRSFFVAKRVRTSTRIGEARVSVSSVAVDLARKIFGDLSEKTVLLIGGGKMGRLALRSLQGAGIGSVMIANRTPERARELARRFAGAAVPMEELEEQLVNADIALVCTGSREIVIDLPTVEAVASRRRHRYLFMIDTAVPRNVRPEVNELDGVFLYDIDDLQRVVEANRKERQDETAAAREIVAQEVLTFLARQGQVDMGPVLGAFRRRLEEMCLEELRGQRDGFDREQYQALELMMKRAAHKIAHPLMIELKNTPESDVRRNDWLDLIRRVFRIDLEK